MTQRSFTCPDCGITSHHPEDVRHCYCASCHEFKQDPARRYVHLLHGGVTACGVGGWKLPDGHRWIRLEEWPEFTSNGLAPPAEFCAGCDQAFREYDQTQKGGPMI